MKTYKIKIVETLVRVETIEASNPQEAQDILIDKYNDGEIVLDYSDFQDVEFYNIGGEE